MFGNSPVGGLSRQSLDAHNRAARSVRPGRLQARSVYSAAASFPLPFLRGGRGKSTSQQPTYSHKSALQQRTDDQPTPDGSQPASSYPQRHHVSAKPFVQGSPPGMLGGSHTQPANSGIAAHGCYRVIGPARIIKRGDCLIARLLPGSRLELLSSGGGCASSVEAVPSPPSAHSHLMHHHHHHIHHGSATGASSRGFSAEEVAAGNVEWGSFDSVQCACASDASGSEGNSDGDAGEGDGEEDGAVAECVLVASYVELGGSASSVDLVDTALQGAVHHHNGHTYLSVRNLPSSATITLSADGDLSHPVNVTPSPPPSSLQ